MDIFERNLHAIEAKDRTLSDMLMIPGGEATAFEETRSGDLTFRYKDLYFHSRYDPWKEALSQAREVLKKKSDWVVLFGLGCGYLLKTLVKKGKKKIIVFEPGVEILKGVMRRVDLSGELALKDVHLCVNAGSVVSKVRDEVEGIDDLIGYQALPYRQAFHAELKEYIERVRNANTTKAGCEKENCCGQCRH